MLWPRAHKTCSNFAGWTLEEDRCRSPSPRSSWLSRRRSVTGRAGPAPWSWCAASNWIRPAREQITDALVPGPVMPTLLAGLALAGLGDLPAAKAPLPDLAVGRASVAVGLTTGTMTGTWFGDGTLRVDGELNPVLGGGSTSH